MAKPKGIKNPNDEDLLDLMSPHIGSCDLGSHKKRGIFRSVLTVGCLWIGETHSAGFGHGKMANNSQFASLEIAFCFAKKKKEKHFLLTFSQTLVVC